jgi:hypothetical protein
MRGPRQIYEGDVVTEPAQTSDSSVNRTLASLDAMSRLLTMNCTIEASRASVVDRFTVTANRVTELAPPSGAGVERGPAPGPSAISVALEGALSSFAPLRPRP